MVETLLDFNNLKNKMEESNFNRRSFIKNTTIKATGLTLLSALSEQAVSANLPTENAYGAEPRIKFSVIGINHGHIYGVCPM